MSNRRFGACRWTVVCALLSLIPSLLGAQESEIEVLRARVARLETVVEQLSRLLEVSSSQAPQESPTQPTQPTQPESSDERVAEIERQIDILAEELERISTLENDSVEVAEGEHGLGRAASKVYAKEQGLSVGGYGEMLYESFSASQQNGERSGKQDEIDFLRGVLYFGYRFNDRWLFNSEIEFEHASTGQSGEASLEFAYLDYLHRPEFNLRAGLLLVPMGWTNELHEPTLFLSTERPNVERNILPSTWRENGVGVFGDLGPFSYRTYVVNGLDASGFSSAGIRGGRQKGSQAKAEDFAVTGRLDYAPTPGLVLGASFYAGDSGQGLSGVDGRKIEAQTEIFDFHLDWKWRGWQVRGLFAQAEVEDALRLNEVLGLGAQASIASRAVGYYAELGYDLLAKRGEQSSLVPFIRHETLDTQDRVPAGFTSNGSLDSEILTYGLAFRPVDRLIFKLDFQDWSNRSRTAVDQWNLAFGYIF